MWCNIMPSINIIDNEYARLSFDPDKKIVHHCFHPNLDGENLRAVLNGGIELMKTHQAYKWLSDNRELKPHSEEDGRWVNEDWLPRVIAAGWKYWALVVPDDVKGRINMVEFVESFYEKGIRIMVFTDFDAAWDWLENIDSLSDLQLGT